MAHIQLINPNTSATTTALMVEMARSALPTGMTVSGVTALDGAPLIVEPAALARAADAVMALQAQLTGDGIIVAAFGDPGADALRCRLDVPVIGIGEASLRAAASNERRFSIVTTTPRLETPIRARVEQLGLTAQLASLRFTSADPVRLTGDAAALEAAIEALVQQCHTCDGAEAVVIGGGPLSRVAHAIAARAPVAIIEPVPEAVRWLVLQLQVRS